VIDLPDIQIRYPSWVASVVDWERPYLHVEDRMQLAIRISRENVERETGGPFGSAVFELGSGRLVSVGMNLVSLQQNSTLHAEIVALMMAQKRLGHYSLGATDLAAHDLVSSCDPCAMCLGAALWAGVNRMVSAADRDDAHKLGFDEGPVFPQSYAYLRDRGIEVVRGVLRQEAAAVLDLYRSRDGEVYNG
jgi:tRNA(Arg) A34 adenosine deaminase TadA